MTTPQQKIKELSHREGLSRLRITLLAGYAVKVSHIMNYPCSSLVLTSSKA